MPFYPPLPEDDKDAVPAERMWPCMPCNGKAFRLPSGDVFDCCYGMCDSMAAAAVRANADWPGYENMPADEVAAATSAATKALAASASLALASQGTVEYPVHAPPIPPTVVADSQPQIDVSPRSSAVSEADLQPASGDGQELKEV
jgi:hypothetical protein